MAEQQESDEARALARLQEHGAAIVAGVTERLAPYLVDRATRVLDVWGRLDASQRERVDADLRAAADAASSRAVAELRVLFGRDPAAQSATPLEIVRGSRREPTKVLADAGVAAVRRDAFEERAWPDDRYALVPRSFADLYAEGEDDELGPALLAWGLAKAAALRARSGVNRRGRPQ
jgi:hypothetical protein